MKYLIILILLVSFLGLLYLRLRPYLKIARRMFGVVRDVRGMSRNEVVQPLRPETAADNKLVRCTSCGTWTPVSRAVKLRSSSATYCSHVCLETSAAGSSKRRTAG